MKTDIKFLNAKTNYANAFVLNLKSIGGLTNDLRKTFIDSDLI